MRITQSEGQRAQERLRSRKVQRLQEGGGGAHRWSCSGPGHAASTLRARQGACGPARRRTSYSAPPAHHTTLAPSHTFAVRWRR